MNAERLPGTVLSTKFSGITRVYGARPESEAMNCTPSNPDISQNTHKIFLVRLFSLPSMLPLAAITPKFGVNSSSPFHFRVWKHAVRDATYTWFSYRQY